MRPLVLSFLLCVGCASTVVPGAMDARADTTADVVTDTAHDGCPAGTCIWSSMTACAMAGGPRSGCCHCANDGTCDSPCRCASPDTPIATPNGSRAIAKLHVGDLVLSVDHGRTLAVPIIRTNRTLVANHHVMRVELQNGAVLMISPMHPTADGRMFGDLREGDSLGSMTVRSATLVSYRGNATYDILPAGDTGTYFASGALIGSTLAH